ncbi:MAG: MFS transporter [Anaerolineae bacterium]
MARLRPRTRDDRNALLLYLNMALQGLVAAGATAYLSIFAVRLGASTLMVGLLTGLPSLVLVLTAVPAGRLVARQRRILPAAVRSSTLFALAYVIIALVPWLAPGWAGAAIVLIWAVAAVPSGFAEVSSTTVLAEAVPLERRATVMSTRFAIQALVAAAALPAVGYLLDTMPFPTGYQVVFVVSFAAAMAGIYAFSRLQLAEPEGPPKPPAGSEGLLQLFAGLSQLRVSRTFALYLASLSLFRLGMALPQPLFSIFWVNHLHLTDSDIALASTVVYILSIAAYFAWGAVANRHGHGPVLTASALGLALYPLITALAQGLPPILLASVTGGLFSSGYSFATFNVLLALAPPQRRADYIALNAVSVYATSLVGPIVGSALAGVIGIRAAMLVAAAARLLGGLLFLVRPVRE